MIIKVPQSTVQYSNIHYLYLEMLPDMLAKCITLIIFTSYKKKGNSETTTTPNTPLVTHLTELW